jgi:ubiquinone/menaquinone biosynthesis C-methylase UbiE
LVSAGLWKNWVFEVVPYVHIGRVLEIGHGPGHLLVELLENGVTIIGLDKSCYMSRQAETKLNRLNLPLNLITGLSDALPFPNHHFQQVVSTFPSEFILDTNSLSEIYRILRPGGEMVLLPVAWITGKNCHQRLAAWLFKITCLAPTWDNELTRPLARIGFQIHTHFIERSAYNLIVILAKKLEISY